MTRPDSTVNVEVMSFPFSVSWSAATRDGLLPTINADHR